MSIDKFQEQLGQSNDPPWVHKALNDLGIHEIPGPRHNARVLQMFKDAGHPEIKDDETAWCAAAVGAWLQEAGIRPSGSLMARSYLKWGHSVKGRRVPRGAVVVFPRGHDGVSGHVGIVLEDQGDQIKMIAGNQSDQVKITFQEKSRALDFRWPNKAPIKKEVSVAVGAGAASEAVKQALPPPETVPVEQAHQAPDYFLAFLHALPSIFLAVAVCAIIFAVYKRMKK